MRVFSTKAAEKQAVSHHFRTILADQTFAKVLLTAYDEGSSDGSSIWCAADENNRFHSHHSPKTTIVQEFPSTIHSKPS